MSQFLSYFYGGLPQLAGLFSASLVWLGLAAIGRVVAPRGLSVAAPVFGWGVANAVFTLFGVWTGISFTVLAAILAALAAGCSVVVLRREGIAPLQAPAMLGALALPLLILVSAMGASQWDEFSHWLPSAKFLLFHDGFPGMDAAETGASFPAYPYGWPLLIYLGAVLAGPAIENVGPLLNLMMLLGFGVVILDVVRRTVPGISGAAFGWPALALAALAVTVLNPTFVQKLVLTSYSETSTMVSVGVAGVLAWMLLNQLADQERADGALVWQWALTLIVLVNTRATNIIFFAIFVLAWLLISGRDGKIAFPRAVMVLAAAAVPAMIVYGSWRLHVATELPGAELTIRPVETWFIGLIPDILAGMALVASKKGVFFALMLIVLGFGIRGIIRCRTELDRFAVIASGVFLGFNVFLLFAYVASFGQSDALRTASYWRYNTHMGLIGLVFLSMAVAILWHRLNPAPVFGLWLKRLSIVLILVLPIVLVQKIRFDLEPPKPHFRAVAAALADAIPGGARYFVLDPRGTGESHVITNFSLWPARRSVGYLAAVHRISEDALTRSLSRPRITHIVLHSVTDEVRRFFDLELAGDRSYLLARRGTDWRIDAEWPYPPRHRF